MTTISRDDIKYPEMVYLTNEELCDVVFVVNGQRIPANKQFLSVKSKVFKVLFKTKNKLNKSGQTVLPIEDTTYKAFNSLIWFLYCNELVLEDDNDFQLINDLSKLSKKYQIYRLLDRISQKTTNNKKTKQLFETIKRIANQTNDNTKYPEMDYIMDEESSDVVFIVGRQRVPALKQILIIKSRVFRAMFSGKFKESDEKEVVIEGTTFEAFRIFITHLYCDQFFLKIDYKSKLIRDVFELFDRYEILRIDENTFNCLTITSENFTTLIEMAFNYKNEKLKTNIMYFINENINYLHRNNFKDIQDFNDRTNDKLFDLLISNKPKENSDLDYFYVEDQVFSASKELLENNCNYTELTSDKLSWSNSFRVDGTNYKAFRAFIGFIYFEKLIFKPNNNLKIYRLICHLAKTYSVSGLLSQISAVLQNRITLENSIEFLKFASDFDIEDLRFKVIDLINENIDQFVERVVEYMSALNDKTKFILLELLADKRLRSCDGLVQFYIDGQRVLVIKECFINNSLLKNKIRFSGEDQEVFIIDNITLSVFQALVGLLYFNQLIFNYKTEIDFELIRDVCKILKFNNQREFIERVGHYLNEEINCNNCEIIKKIVNEFNITFNF